MSAPLAPHPLPLPQQAQLRSRRRSLPCVGTQSAAWVLADTHPAEAKITGSGRWSQPAAQGHGGRLCAGARMNGCRPAVRAAPVNPSPFIRPRVHPCCPPPSPSSLLIEGANPASRWAAGTSLETAGHEGKGVRWGGEGSPAHALAPSAVPPLRSSRAPAGCRLGAPVRGPPRRRAAMAGRGVWPDEYELELRRRCANDKN
jgi:hypothetical protein